MYDQRLFNQTGGLGSGFNKEDDEYDLFDKPLFADRTAASIYKNVKNINVDNYTKKVLGNKQENAAYPSGMCAERTALYFKGANFPHTKIKMMAIVIIHMIKQK